LYLLDSKLHAIRYATLFKRTVTKPCHNAVPRANRDKTRRISFLPIAAATVEAFSRFGGIGSTTGLKRRTWANASD
jgi:hypothetical protein